jgi:hypothetical protein
VAVNVSDRLVAELVDVTNFDVVLEYRTPLVEVEVITDERDVMQLVEVVPD